MAMLGRARLTTSLSTGAVVILMSFSLLGEDAGIKSV
jgi:hypothetical protein